MSPFKPTIFYFSVNNAQNGPFQVSDIATMLERGEIRLDTKVWAEGMPEWLPLKEAFKDVLPTPPPIAENRADKKKEASLGADDQTATCKACGALVEPTLKECGCCGVPTNGNDVANGTCSDCAEPKYPDQWFCVSCYCPFSTDKKFLKAIEKYAYNLEGALANIPYGIRTMLENGNETVEYISGKYILTNRRIFECGHAVTYRDPKDSSRWLVGSLITLTIAGCSGAFLGPPGMCLGLVIGVIVAVVSVLCFMGESKTKSESIPLNPLGLEDITTIPQAKSSHQRLGNLPIDSYWVQFDSLKGAIEIKTSSFDSALVFARNIRDAMDAHAAGKPTVLHTLGMVLRRMKAKGIEYKSAA